MLDEPTNDLDLATLRVLEETLTSFDGCVVVVSHDRYFLNRVCTDILAFEGNGVTVFQPGDYSYYVEKRAAAQAQQRAEAQADKAKTAPPPAAPATRRPGKLKWKEQQELDGMEDAISTAEAKVAELETMFSAPDFHAKYGKQTQQMLADLNAAKAEVERLYARWDELESLKNG